MDSFALVFNMYLFIKLFYFVCWMRNGTCVLFCVWLMNYIVSFWYYINVSCYRKTAKLVGILL